MSYLLGRCTEHSTIQYDSSRLHELQVGDAALEMAMTQWLSIFEGMDLIIPGLASRGTDAGAPEGGTFCGVRRPASSTGLATYLRTLKQLVLAFAAVRVRVWSVLQWL